MKREKLKMVAGVMAMSMVVTGMISGTLAKYTTGDSASDHARVAKWGVEVQAVGFLYGDEYGSDNQVIGSHTANTISVAQTSDDTDNWVAPGTKNDQGLKFSVTGTPEVAGNVTATISYENIYLTAGKYGLMKAVSGVTEENISSFGTLYFFENDLYKRVSEDTDLTDKTFYSLEDYVELESDYYPVEYKMTGSGTSKSYNTDFSVANNVDSLEGVVNSIVSDFAVDPSKTQIDSGKRIKTYSKSFEANENLAEYLALGNQSIIWKWDFCQSNPACKNGDDACGYCKADTILANLMMEDSLNGQVVKSNDGNNYKKALAASGQRANDYNLETQFDINLTVTQTD